MLPPASEPLVPSGLAEVELDELGQDAEVRDILIPTDLHRDRLDRALVALLPEFSRNHLKHLIEDGCVSTASNALPITKVAHLVKAAETYSVRLQPTEMSQAYLPQAMDLAVVFEDAHLRVIHKPVGLVVHPAPGNWSGTLLNGLLARDDSARFLPRAGIVHRLDKDTSGLMVVAKTRETMDRLVEMIAAREVSRDYLAVGHRAWQGSRQQQVALPIGRDPRNRLRMAVVDLERHSGKTALTDISLLDNQDAHCLVRCKLHTGRTHQIRVHMASLGHPLVSDELYGGAAAAGLNRQALHARRLAFAHPCSAEALAFVAPVPDDLEHAIQALGLSYNGKT